MKGRKTVLVLAAALAMGIPAARAADCQLKLAAALQLGRTPEGLPTANVTIGGKDYPFLVATSSIISIMNFTTYGDLKVNHVHASGVYEGPDELTNVAIVPELMLGGLKGKNQQFYVNEDDRLPPGIVGRIGLDKLELYDVELDLAHDKFNLFSQDHCKGQVIYWTDTAASVPFVIQDRDRQFSVPMKLDDVPVNVLIDTASPDSWMTYATEQRLFGGARKAQDLDQPDTLSVSRVPTHTFKTLTIGGLTISNPDIVIANTRRGDNRICDGESHETKEGREYRCYGGGDLHLGLKQLRRLRLVIAFSEKTLYITPADAH